MTLGFDDVTFSSIGTGVTETRLNGDASLVAPDKAKNIMEIIPYQMQLGAFTVDESLMTAFRIQSDDVPVEPKRFVLYGVGTGDASFTAVYCPVLRAYPMNVPLRGGERINYYATAQVANTVAPGVGATVVYSEGMGGAQQYYQKPDNETAGGTTINTRTAGGTITVVGGSRITSLYCLVTGAVATASEHDVGFMEFQSSDFNTSMPYRVAIQPTATGLGAAANALTGGEGLMEYNMGGEGIPINSSGQTIINTFYTNRDGRTGASNFIGCVRYVK